MLVVEGNADDAKDIDAAFSTLKLRNTVQFVSKTEEMMAYMEGTGEYADRTKFPYPCAIILDIDLPHIDGTEALTWLRASQLHRTVPTIVIGKPETLVGLRNAVTLGASAYMTKPFQSADFRRLAQSLNLAVEFTGE